METSALGATHRLEGTLIPFVFLHGFFGSPLDWSAVCAELPAAHCLAIPLPGHSGAPFTEHFFEAMPSLPRMHLVGYSMGGRLAMQYAARFPDQIASLTLISTHLGLKSEEEKQKRLLHDAAWAKKLLEWDIDTFSGEWYQQPIFGGFQPDLTERRKQDRKLLAQALLHYSLGRQPYMPLQQGQMLVGERDEKFRRLYPDATVIPGAGHMVHLENPTACAACIRSWAAKTRASVVAQSMQGSVMESPGAK